MRRASAWLLAATGVALAVVLVAMARPAAIVALLARSRPGGLVAAFAGTVLVLLLRGSRLALVAGRRLPPGRAIAVAAASNAAVVVLPLRAGELALVPLLRAAGVPGTIRGLSLLVSVRLLDIAGLLVWVAVAAAALDGRHGWPALALAALPLLAAGLVAVALRLLRRAARRWRTAGGVRRRALLQLLQVRRELREAVRSPLRVGGALLLSVAIWGGIWLYTLLLVRAMGLLWPAVAVLLGVIGGAAGAALPLNALGNFGTLEVGWTAALAATGVPAADALAAGFATHLYAVAFNAVLGALGVGCLAFARPRSGR